MATQALDPVILARMKRVIAVVLGALAVVSLVLALVGVWPATWLGVWSERSLRLRFATAFVVLGGGVLALLLVVLVVKRALAALRG